MSAVRYPRTDLQDLFNSTHAQYATEGSILTASSPEEALMACVERAENIHRSKVKVYTLSRCLTKVQFRRVWQHYALGQNVRDIALREGVVHSCIVASIKAAKKKIFEKAGKSTTKTP